MGIKIVDPRLSSKKPSLDLEIPANLLVRLDVRLGTFNHLPQG